jgi:hypothetical protein
MPEIFFPPAIARIKNSKIEEIGKRNKKMGNKSSRIEWSGVE